jgi:hypothetical protein
MMGEPGWESWTDSDSNRDDDDEELPSAEHEAAMASIGEFAHDEDMFHTQGLSYNPTNTTVASNPVSPLATTSPPVTPEPAETRQALLHRQTDLDLLQIETERELHQRRTELHQLQHQAEQQLQLNQVHVDPASSSSDKETPLTESQLRILATLHGPEAERMTDLFRDNNSQGTVQSLLRYSEAAKARRQATPPDHAASPSEPFRTTTSQLQGLSAQALLNAMPASKEENMARILLQVAKTMDRK